LSFASLKGKLEFSGVFSGHCRGLAITAAVTRTQVPRLKGGCLILRSLDHKSFYYFIVLSAIIEEVSSMPFGVDPQIMMSIVKGLYTLNPGEAGFLLSHIPASILCMKFPCIAQPA